MERRKLSVKGVDPDVIEMLAELRDHERRFTGAVLGDAIRDYYNSVFWPLDQDEQDQAA